MKNKMLFILNSIKQSVINKPFAFVLLILIFFAMTASCCIPSLTAVEKAKQLHQTPMNLSFQLSTENFKQNHTEIGDYIQQNKDILTAQNSKLYCNMNIRHFDCEIKINNNSQKIKEIHVAFILTGNKYMSNQSIVDKEKIAVVNLRFAQKFGIVEGDTINIYGNQLVVKNICTESSHDMTEINVPYSLPINEWYSCTPQTTYEFEKPQKELTFSGRIIGLNRSSESKFKSFLKKQKCKIEFYFSDNYLMEFMLIFFVMLICMLSSLSILGYWLKCNNKKYSTYKTLGCTPKMLALTMFIEIFVFATIAICFGLVFCYILTINVEFDIIGFEWLHYLLIFASTFVSILLVTFYAIIKQAKAMPANSKYNQ